MTTRALKSWGVVYRLRALPAGNAGVGTRTTLEQLPKKQELPGQSPSALLSLLARDPLGFVKCQMTALSRLLRGVVRESRSEPGKYFAIHSYS